MIRIFSFRHARCGEGQASSPTACSASTLHLALAKREVTDTLMGGPRFLSGGFHPSSVIIPSMKRASLRRHVSSQVSHPRLRALYRRLLRLILRRVRSGASINQSISLSLSLSLSLSPCPQPCHSPPAYLSQALNRTAPWHGRPRPNAEIATSGRLSRLCAREMERAALRTA